MRFSSSVLSGQTDRQNAKEKKSLTNRLIEFAAFVFCDRLYLGLFSAYPRLDFSEHGSSLEVNFERSLHSHICHQLLFGIYIT